jgi:hypothetical protein
MLRRSVVSLVGVALFVMPSALASRAGAQTSNPSGDVAVAVAGTIQQGDVPSTFTETSSGSSTEGPTPQKSPTSLDKEAMKIKECKSFTTAVASNSRNRHVTATATGPGLEEETTQVGSSVKVYDVVTQAKQIFTSLEKSSLVTCLDKLFKLSIRNQLDQTDSTVKFTKFTAVVKPHPVPPVGDQTVDYQLRMDIVGTAKQSGKNTTVKLTVYGDFQFVQTGRTIGYYTFLGIGKLVDNVQQPAVSAAAERLTQALASGQ